MLLTMGRGAHRTPKKRSVFEALPAHQDPTLQLVPGNVPSPQTKTQGVSHPPFTPNRKPSPKPKNLNPTPNLEPEAEQLQE